MCPQANTLPNTSPGEAISNISSVAIEFWFYILFFKDETKEMLTPVLSTLWKKIIVRLLLRPNND